MQRGILVLILLVAVTLIGCGGNDADQETPASVFNATHGGKTITPHGEIVSGSAKDVEGGAVQDKTSDGQSWQVDPSGKGSYGTPERVNSGI